MLARGVPDHSRRSPGKTAPALHRACGQEPSQPRGRCPCLALRGAVFTQEAFSEVDTKHFSSFSLLLWGPAGAASGPEVGAGHCDSTQGPPREAADQLCQRGQGSYPEGPVPAPDAAAAGRAGGRTGAAPPSPAPGLGQDSAGTGMRNYWLSEARRPQGAEEESRTCPQVP